MANLSLRTTAERKRLVVAGITLLALVGLLLTALIMQRSSNEISLVATALRDTANNAVLGIPVEIDGYELVGANDKLGIYGLWSSLDTADALWDMDARLQEAGYSPVVNAGTSVFAYVDANGGPETKVLMYGISQGEGSCITLEVRYE